MTLFYLGFIFLLICDIYLPSSASNLLHNYNFGLQNPGQPNWRSLFCGVSLDLCHHWQIPLQNSVSIFQGHHRHLKVFYSSIVEAKWFIQKCPFLIQDKLFCSFLPYLNQHPTIHILEYVAYGYFGSCCRMREWVFFLKQMA